MSCDVTSKSLNLLGRFSSGTNVLHMNTRKSSLLCLDIPGDCPFSPKAQSVAFGGLLPDRPKVVLGLKFFLDYSVETIGELLIMMTQFKMTFGQCSNGCSKVWTIS